MATEDCPETVEEARAVLVGNGSLRRAIAHPCRHRSGICVAEIANPTRYSKHLLRRTTQVCRPMGIGSLMCRRSPPEGKSSSKPSHRRAASGRSRTAAEPNRPGRDGKEIYFISGSKFKAVEVKASGSSFEASIPRDLFEVQLDSINRRNRYVATPDGQRFLFVTTPKSLDTTPFVVVQNWQTLLNH